MCRIDADSILAGGGDKEDIEYIEGFERRWSALRESFGLIFVYTAE